MIFTIGFLKSENTAIVKNFDLTTESYPKTINLDDIKEENINLLVTENFGENEGHLAILEEENKFYPVADASNLNLTEERFTKLTFHEARDIIKKTYSTWTLDNNLKTIEGVFQTIDHLKELWPNDRMDFFEEFWFILKKNLGTRNLKLIFNSIKVGEKAHQKNQLVQFRVDGTRLPSPHVGDDFEKSLMESYRKNLEDTFNVTEYDKGQGQLVICGSIKESPVIIMAELFDFSGIQKSLLKALFEGLQSV